MPRFLARRFDVPAGTIASATLDPASRVDAALDDSVASPDEQQIDAGFQCALDLGRGLAALRNFVPSRIRHPRALEGATQLQEASANGLSFVRDDADLHAAPDSAVGRSRGASREHE